MKIGIKVFILLAAAVTVWSTDAQTSGRPETVRAGLSLRQCLEYALEGNHLIRQARYDESIASAKTDEIVAGLLPQISAGVVLTDNLARPRIMLPGELTGTPGKNVPVEIVSPYEARANVELSQVIFDPALFTGIHASRNAEELAVLRSRLTEEELIYDVGMVFYDILRSERELECVISNLVMQDSLYRNTAGSVERGSVREIDRSRIKVGITNLEVRREQLKSVVEQQKQYLKILISIPLDNPLLLNGDDLREVSTLSIEGDNISDRTELYFLQKQKEMSQMSLRQIKSRYLPSLALVAGGGLQFQSDKLQLSQSSSWFDHSFVGLRLSIPIFAGLRNQKRVRQQQLNICKLDEDIDFTERSIRAEYENARQELTGSYLAVDAQKENLSLAEKIYEQSRALYAEGSYSVTDLLQTEHTLHAAQTAYWSEMANHKKARLKLMKATGTLKELLK